MCLFSLNCQLGFSVNIYKFLHECAEKVELQISFPKTNFILITKCVTTNRINHYKYPGEIVGSTGTEERELKTRKTYGKLQLFLQLQQFFLS